MDPTYLTKKVVDLTDAELIGLGFTGENVAPGIKGIVEKVRADPAHLGTVTCFMVDCMKRKAHTLAQDTAQLPASTPHDASTLRQEPNDTATAHTIVAPDLVSKYEQRFWYHGLSDSPPALLWRSDLATNPFPGPFPPPGSRFFTIPRKTAHGVSGTPLNAVWDDTVAPRVLAAIKARGLRYSALMTARFATTVHDDGGHTETMGPVVVWIAVRPGTTTAAAVRDATPDILRILHDAEIYGVVVEWCEASVVRLAGPPAAAPPLMRVKSCFDPHPTSGLDHSFNARLSVPIARQADDAEGTVALLFREVKTRSGEPSDRVLALTTKHVASADTSTDYDYEDEGDGADRQHVLVCGDRQFHRAVAEIEDAVAMGLRQVVGLARRVADLESRLGTPKEDQSALERTKRGLVEQTEANATLQAFFAEVDAEWRDPAGHRLGVVDWAPRISVDDSGYTRDIATLVVDEARLQNFEGNIVDLGNQYGDSIRLSNLFWPPTAVREGMSVPDDLQLPIRRALPHNRIFNHNINPDTEPPVVGKYGAATKLTFGRYAGTHAYICTDQGVESREIAIYNHSKTSDSFAAPGDSGALVFTGEGDALAVLHSGSMSSRGGGDSHVAFGTPVWWVIEQVRERYPFAEFYGMACDRD